MRTWYQVRLLMSLELIELNSGDVLFDYSPAANNWWITGFDPSHQNAQAENLQVTITIDFSDNPELFNGFYNEYGPHSNSNWSFSDGIATMTW